MTRDTLLAALGHLHYESGFTPDSVPQDMTENGILRKKKGGIVVQGDALYWHYDGRLRTAVIRQDGWLEYREYFATAHWHACSHWRALYRGWERGDDSDFERTRFASIQDEARTSGLRHYLQTDGNLRVELDTSWPHLAIVWSSREQDLPQWISAGREPGGTERRIFGADVQRSDHKGRYFELVVRIPEPDDSASSGLVDRMHGRAIVRPWRGWEMPLELTK
jgi:hypothetical protein